MVRLYMGPELSEQQRKACFVYAEAVRIRTDAERAFDMIAPSLDEIELALETALEAEELAETMVRDAERELGRAIILEDA